MIVSSKCSDCKHYVELEKRLPNGDGICTMCYAEHCTRYGELKEELQDYECDDKKGIAKLIIEYYR